jgi:hypothetical protein
MRYQGLEQRFPVDVPPTAATPDTNGKYTVSIRTLRFTTANSKDFVCFAQKQMENMHMATNMPRALLRRVKRPGPSAVATSVTTVVW